MVHRVYICSNLKFPFIVQKYDQPEDCNCNNLVLAHNEASLTARIWPKSKKEAHSDLDICIRNPDLFQEGEHYCLLPTTYPPTKLKPRTI
jgi:hypothetical protein